MKKLVCIFLCVLMIFGLLVVSANAEVSTPTDTEYLFKERFLETRVNPSTKSLEYYEVEYHYDETNNIDWALLYADYYWGAPLTTYVIVGDRVATYGEDNIPTTFYWVYDVKKDEFFDICKIQWDDYEGLEPAIAELKIGRPIGDADFDNELTILDATFIQQVASKLCEYNYADSIDDRFTCQGDEKIAYVSDFDRDGERTVMDATAIQMKLAKK